MILGTAAYMSPEQVRGKTVDKRADIWAFGCVLYEILTGARLFAGDSVPETLGLIFSREPDLATLPAAAPARVRTLIVRCLVKDPRQRLRDIGDARLDLEDARDAPVAAPPAAPARLFWRALPWGVAAAAVLLAGWAFWGHPATSTTALPVTHLEIGFPHDVEPGPSTGLGPAISSDGRTVAMIGVSDGVRRAFVRRLDRAEAIALPGVGANGIVFSPDGGSVAVVSASGLITRISLADQQRKVLTSGADVTGGHCVESGGHRLRPRGRAVGRLVGGRSTARAHGARCRPPRSGARQAGGAARGAPRAVCESDHRARRRADRISVDRRRIAVGGG